MTDELLKDVELETKRFLRKLEATKKRLKADESMKYGCKETGALRRAALDLKNELTRITQYDIYSK